MNVLVADVPVDEIDGDGHWSGAAWHVLRGGPELGAECKRLNDVECDAKAAAAANGLNSRPARQRFPCMICGSKGRLELQVRRRGAAAVAGRAAGPDPKWDVASWVAGPGCERAPCVLHDHSHSTKTFHKNNA